MATTEDPNKSLWSYNLRCNHREKIKMDDKVQAGLPSRESCDSAGLGLHRLTPVREAKS